MNARRPTTIWLARLMAVVLFTTTAAPLGLARPRTGPSPLSQGQPLSPQTTSQRVEVPSGGLRVPLQLPSSTSLFSLSISSRHPESLRSEAALTVRLRVGEWVLASKTLHRADPDFFVTFRVERPQEGAELEFVGELAGERADFAVGLRAVDTRQQAVVIEAEPNNRWQEAQEVPLGKTVIGTADDRPYLLAPGQKETEGQGEDWFRMEQSSSQPQLVHFNIETLDRDVPVNLQVYTLHDGKLVPYTRGVDPVSGPHEAQIGPTIQQNGVELSSANKFTTRVLTPGIYYVRVEANHPAYRLRTTVYPVPPYTTTGEAKAVPLAVPLAIQVASDYLIAAGESWLANTPRSGAVTRRDRQPHAEAVLCVACHPTHFSTRGTLAAYESGYTTLQKEALRFVTERLANNPRPFYGPLGASWVRVIGAATTVQSRAAMLLDQYERVTGEKHPDFYRPVGNYLRAYYQRPTFPPDESEQNPPSISNFETGWMAWRVLKRLSATEPEPKWAESRDQVERLLTAEGRGSGTEIKSVEDLCFQTVALAEMGRERYAKRIEANVTRLLALQREDGLWPLDFGSRQPSAEFAAGSVLFALAKAGVKSDHPQVQKAVTTLLARQKPFGGWNTEGQPYETFETPFKETQMVLMGLAALFPGVFNTRQESTSVLRTRPVVGVSVRVEVASGRESVDAILADLGERWEKPSEEVRRQVREWAKSPEPLVRLEAVQALGRWKDGEAVSVLASCLGDETLMVRRAAAQGLREMATVEPKARKALREALGASETRVRRAALRAFAQHFRWLASDTTLLDGVLTCAQRDSDPTVRMQATQALSLWWYWNDTPKIRTRLLDTVLTALGDEKAGEGTLGAFRETLSNLCDENIQYVYTFWTPLLPQESDRKQVLEGYEQAMALQGERIAAALRKGTVFQQRQILTALTEYPTGRAWNPQDQVERNFRRIGNDLDAIDFRGAGAMALRPVLLTLLQRGDSVVRQRALVLTSALRSNGGQPALANAIAARLGDADPAVRGLALQAHRVFPFSNQQVQFGLDPRRFTDESDPNVNAETLPLVIRLMERSQPETQAGALRLLTEFREEVRTEPAVLKQAQRLAKSGDREVLAALFGLAKYLPALREDGAFRGAVAQVLQTAPPGHPARLDALRLALTEAMGQKEPVGPVLEAVLLSRKPEDQADILEVGRSEGRVRDDARLIPLYENALAPGSDLRSQALYLLKQSRTQRTNPAIRLALQEATKTGSLREQELAQELLSGSRGRRDAPETTLDLNFFVAKVQPLLVAKGADGKSCFDCHSNHTLLNLQPPDANRQFTTEATRNNYRSALRVIDLDEPENSLLLRKPLSPGVRSAETGVSHVGGVRWAGKDHPAYRALLQWLNGAQVRQ